MKKASTKPLKKTDYDPQVRKVEPTIKTITASEVYILAIIAEVTVSKLIPKFKWEQKLTYYGMWDRLGWDARRIADAIVSKSNKNKTDFEKSATSIIKWVKSQGHIKKTAKGLKKVKGKKTK